MFGGGVALEKSSVKLTDSLLINKIAQTTSEDEKTVMPSMVPKNHITRLPLRFSVLILLFGLCLMAANKFSSRLKFSC